MISVPSNKPPGPQAATERLRNCVVTGQGDAIAKKLERKAEEDEEGCQVLSRGISLSDIRIPAEGFPRSESGDWRGETVLFQQNIHAQRSAAVLQGPPVRSTSNGRLYPVVRGALRNIARRRNERTVDASHSVAEETIRWARKTFIFVVALFFVFAIFAVSGGSLSPYVVAFVTFFGLALAGVSQIILLVVGGRRV